MIIVDALQLFGVGYFFGLMTPVLLVIVTEIIKSKKSS